MPPATDRVEPVVRLVEPETDRLPPEAMVRLPLLPMFSEEMLLVVPRWTEKVPRLTLVVVLGSWLRDQFSGSLHSVPVPRVPPSQKSA
jgi:hypothetical protein